MDNITELHFKKATLAGIEVSGFWSEDEGGIFQLKGLKTFEQFEKLMGLLKTPAGVPVTFVSPETSNDGTTTSVSVAVQQPTVSVSVQEVAPAATPAPSSADDLSIFGRLNLLGEIVDEIRRRGAADFDSIKTFVKKLMDTESCPALDKIFQTRGSDGFEEKLRTHCASKGIAGAV